MMSPTYGGGGSAKRRRYSISLFSKMGDKRKGGVKNLKKWGNIIFRWHLEENALLRFLK